MQLDPMIVSILKAISGQESNDNPYAENPHSGAYGQFQIMPENWPQWASEAGLGADAPRTPENQNLVAYNKVSQYYQELGDPALVAAAWYAGGGYAHSLKNGDPFYDPDTELDRNGYLVTSSKSNGVGEYPSVHSYMNQVMKRFQNPSGDSGVNPYLSDFNQNQNSYSVQNPNIEVVEPTETPWYQQIGDSFLASYFNSNTGGSLRTMGAYLANGQRDSNGNFYPPDWQVSKEDVDHVVAMLPGDTAAQNYVLLNARSPEHLAYLTAIKKQDSERAKRLQLIGHNWKTVLGGLGGGITDPVFWTPVGAEAAGLKILSRLYGGNKVITALNASKIARLAEVSAETAGIMAGNAYGAEKTAGFQQDYLHSALLGAVAGAGLNLIGGALKGTKVYNSLQNMEDHAIGSAGDLKTPSEIPLDRKPVVAAQHDKAFMDSIPLTDTIKSLVSKGKLFAISKAEALQLGRELNIYVPEHAKAFYNPYEDFSVLIKDNLTSGDNISNLVAHEVGVHAGLRKLVGDDMWSKILNTVAENTKNPKGLWAQAVRMTPEGGAEEVLGAYIQLAGTKSGFGGKLRASINQGLRKAGLNTTLTDTELKDLVENSLRNEADTTRGIISNPDGSVNYMGFKFAAGNAANPHNMEHMFQLEQTVRNISQADMPWFVRRATKFAEEGAYVRTPFGLLSNSVAPLGRKFAYTLFHDARMREYKGSLVMPAENMKRELMQELNTHIASFFEARNKWIFGNGLVENIMNTPKIFQLYSKQQEFNYMVIEAYNHLYAKHKNGRVFPVYSSEVTEAANALKAYDDNLLRIAKNSSSRFGSITKNLLDKDFMPISNEFRRVLDETKWAQFKSKFATEQDCYEWLKKYALTAADDSALEKLGLIEKQKEWDALYANLQNPPTPRPTQLTEAEFDAFKTEAAQKWAYGVTKRSTYNLKNVKADADILNLFHERYPMDTTTPMTTPWGENFSYDLNLRSTDIDFILPRLTNRIAGEAAFRNAFESTAAYEAMREEYAAQLDAAVKHKDGISRAKMMRELKTLDTYVAHLRGVSDPHEGIPGVVDALGRAMQGLSYSQNGGMMTIAQIGEMGNAISHTGGAALIHAFPLLTKLFRETVHGNDVAAFMKDAEYKIFGDALEAKVFSSGLGSQTWNDALAVGAGRTGANAAMRAINFASKLTSTVNQLGAMTERMIRGARSDTLMDAIRWAHGEDFSKGWSLRNPFSKAKLKAAGVDAQMAQRIQDDFKKYTTLNADGKPVAMDIEQWRDTSPDTYYKMRFLIENQSMRAIQQATIGNTNILKDANFFTRMMFQFKDFSMRAINGQTLRFMTHREREDALGTAYGLALNLGLYALLTRAKAEAYFKDDPGKQQQYLDDRLSNQTLAHAALIRTAMTGSALQPFQDLGEALLGAQSFRTTVDRTASYNPKGNHDRDWSQIAGDFITQLPAMNTSKHLFFDTPRALFEAVAPDNLNIPLNQQHLLEAYRVLPVQNFIPFTMLANEIINSMDIPRKPIHKKKVSYFDD